MAISFIGALAVLTSVQGHGQQAYPHSILVPQVEPVQSPCEMVAIAIAYEIEVAEANRSQPEKSPRYQALKQDWQFRGFKIPTLLSLGMQSRMDGADFGDVYDAVQAKCNANLRK